MVGRKVETDPYALVYDAVVYGCKTVGDIEIHTGIGPLRIRDEIKRLVTMGMICVIPGTTNHYRVRKDSEDTPTDSPPPVKSSRPSEIGISLTKELIDIISALPEDAEITATETYEKLRAFRPAIAELSDQHYVKHQTAAIMRTLVGKGLTVSSSRTPTGQGTMYRVDRGSRANKRPAPTDTPPPTPKRLVLPATPEPVSLDIVEDAKDAKDTNPEKISARRNDEPQLKMRFTVLYRGLLVGCDSIEDLNTLAERNQRGSP